MLFNMTNPVCPKTGASMHRGVRSLTLTYKGGLGRP